VDGAQSFATSQQDRGKANLGVPGRNLIRNGQGRINQRNYVSGAATTGANQFTLDRWFVVTSGQNLAFTGDESRRVMTAPAGGVSQVIEGADIVGGTYVLNWSGTATATVNGTARTKGETFTLTANTNAAVRFSGGTFSDVQLELASLPTAYERLEFGEELADCQRFCVAGTGNPALNPVGSTSNISSSVNFPVRMRATPSVAWDGMTVSFVNPTGMTGFSNTAGSSWNSGNSSYIASAEITS
jgi:hypothetical protein